MNRQPDSDDKPLILVTVGTDHHPFDRLVGWVDRWVKSHSDDVRCVIQYGTSYPPEQAEGTEYLAPATFQEHLATAAAVVCHGGPSTIMEVRGAGILPIVVPRDPTYGEHVDGHQVTFAAHLAKHSRIRFPQDEDELVMTLDRALTHPDEFRVTSGADPDVANVATFSELIDGLIRTPRRSLLPRSKPKARR